MTEQQEATFLVDAYEDPVIVRVVGRASHLNAAPLRDFFDRMIAQGRRRFVVDMRDCTTVDSTFLGILAGAALKLRDAEPPGQVTLCRLGSRNLELVRNLGLHRLAHVDASADDLSFEKCDEQLEKGARSEKESARMILQAHEDLCLIDGENRQRFQDVIAFLRNQVEAD